MTAVQRRAAVALDRLQRPEPDPEREVAASRAAWRHLRDVGVLADAGPEWAEVIVGALTPKAAA